MKLKTLCLLLSILLGAASANALGTGTREVIVHSALRPANWDIYLFDSPENPPRRLTDDPALDYNAVFSPDGRWVVFCSERRGNPDLYVIELQGASSVGAARLLLDSPFLEDAPTFSPDGRHLVFVCTRDGNADLFTMPFQPDRTMAIEKARNLTRSPHGELNPAFSPDGKHIAFCSDRDTFPRYGMRGVREGDIYVMDADGSNLKRLTDSKGWDGSPAWSADGKAMYFYSERDGGLRVWRMNNDGTGAQALSASGVKALSPAPLKGGRVAFAALMDKHWRLVSVAADGTDQRLESDARNDYWAPDYDRKSARFVCHGTAPVAGKDLIEGLAFEDSHGKVPFKIEGAPTSVQLADRLVTLHSFRSFTNYINPRTGNLAAATWVRADVQGFSVATSHFDGTGLREVFTPPGGAAWGVVCSPDGEWIAFTAGPPFAPAQAPADVWKMRADGSGLTNLTENCKANDAFPDFSPDGRRIAFRSGRDGNQEIYVMNSDGSSPRRLTNHTATDTMPAFSPDGATLAFASNRDGDFEIYLLRLSPDGTPGDLRRITRSPGADTHPRFSPDGKWLVFASERAGLGDEEPLNPIFNPQPYGEIFALRLADGYTVRLTHNKWEDGVPVWAAVKEDKSYSTK